MKMFYKRCFPGGSKNPGNPVEEEEERTVSITAVGGSKTEIGSGRWQFLGFYYSWTNGSEINV